MAGEENIFAVNRLFIEMMGELEGGAFLSQLIYWSDKGKREDGYFYKKYETWYEEIGVTEYKIRKIAERLQKVELLSTKLVKAEGSPTVHYKLDKTKLIGAIIEFIRLKEALKEQEKSLKDMTLLDYKKFKNGNLNIKESYLENRRMESKIPKNELLKILVSSITETTSSITPKNTQEEKTILTDVKQISKNVIVYLNEKAGTSFSLDDKYTVQLIEKILAGGYVEDDLKLVVDKKTTEWLGNPKTEVWLRPSTLFKEEKFNEYLNQKVVSQEVETDYPVPAFIKELEKERARKVQEKSNKAQENAYEFDLPQSEIRKQTEEF